LTSWKKDIANTLLTRENEVIDVVTGLLDDVEIDTYINSITKDTKVVDLIESIPEEWTFKDKLKDIIASRYFKAGGDVTNLEGLVPMETAETFLLRKIYAGTLNDYGLWSADIVQHINNQARPHVLQNVAYKIGTDPKLNKATGLALIDKMDELGYLGDLATTFKKYIRAVSEEGTHKLSSQEILAKDILKDIGNYFYGSNIAQANKKGIEGSIEDNFNKQLGAKFMELFNSILGKDKEKLSQFIDGETFFNQELSDIHEIITSLLDDIQLKYVDDVLVDFNDKYLISETRPLVGESYNSSVLASTNPDGVKALVDGTTSNKKTAVGDLKAFVNNVDSISTMDYFQTVGRAEAAKKYPKIYKNVAINGKNVTAKEISNPGSVLADILRDIEKGKTEFSFMLANGEAKIYGPEQIFSGPIGTVIKDLYGIPSSITNTKEAYEMILSNLKLNIFDTKVNKSKFKNALKDATLDASSFYKKTPNNVYIYKTLTNLLKDVDVTERPGFMDKILSSKVLYNGNQYQVVAYKPMVERYVVKETGLPQSGLKQ
jgi:hypothetical protein